MSNMSYLPKVISSEPNRVNSLLIETITLLCRNGLSFTKQLKIEGMIGITIDDSEIALIHINEFLHPNSNSSDLQQQHCKSKSTSSSQFKSTNDNINCISYSEMSNSYSLNNTQTIEPDIKPNGNKEFIVESFLFNTESPSDEDENSLKVESSRKESQHSGCEDIRQNLVQCNNPLPRSIGLDPPHASSIGDKSVNMVEPPLEISHIKCETIDITDEEDCDGDYEGHSLRDRQLGVYSNNRSMTNQIFQRGLNNSRAFQSREVTQNDGFSAKPLIQSDEFLVTMNLDEHVLMSEQLPHLREDAGWQGSSRYNHATTENDFDHGYQFLPRKRTVGSVDNRPYACPVVGCDRRFFHRNNVYRHRKQKHPLDVVFKT